MVLILHGLNWNDWRQPYIFAGNLGSNPKSIIYSMFVSEDGCKYFTIVLHVLTSTFIDDGGIHRAAAFFCSLFNHT